MKGVPRLKLCMLGGGVMGRALLAGWLRRQVLDLDHSLVVDPSDQSRQLIADMGIKTVSHWDQVPTPAADLIIVLAVKPQVCDGAITQAKNQLTPHNLLISLAAGRSIASLSRHLEDHAPIVRAMPNLPARVCHGITVACANYFVSDKHLSDTTLLFESCGQCLWTKKEEDLDPVTAIAGSGPAYFFYFVEALATAGKKVGLESEMAEKLAQAVAVGSGILLQDTPESASHLRRQVTSPGGVTAAAIKTLQEMHKSNFEDVICRAVQSACRRASELNES